MELGTVDFTGAVEIPAAIVVRAFDPAEIGTGVSGWALVLAVLIETGELLPDRAVFLTRAVVGFPAGIASAVFTSTV